MKIAALLLLAACSGPLRTGDQRWPIVCAGPNTTGEWIQAVAQDGDFRTRAFVKLPPFGDRRCEFWPWQHHKGRIGYVIYPDTNWMRWQEIGR